MTCPLPIDWLDYLDGERPDLSEHLERCASCAAVLARLQAAKPSVTRRWLDRVHLTSLIHWHEDRPSSPTVGEFWLTAPSLADALASYADLDRVMVVVLTSPDDDHARSWVDVAPIASDTENATSLDLIIRADENTLGTSWRVVFRDQLSLAVEQLDARFGSLNKDGQKLLTRALEGDLDYARTGTALESEFDPRLALSEERQPTLMTLGSLRAYAEDRNAADAQVDEDEATADVIVLPTTSNRIPFQIKTEAWRGKWGLLAAADSPKRTRRRVGAAWEQSHLDGFLRWEARCDRLLFVIESVENVNAPVRVVVQIRDRRDPLWSEAFVPREGEEITLAEGEGVDDRLVEHVELELER